MDLDIEMGDSFGAADGAHPEVVTEDILISGEVNEPGEVTEEVRNDVSESTQSTNIVPSKLHISGVDTLHTDDIKSYVREHYGEIERVQWIDDNSANLVFTSDSAAREALAALSVVEVVDATAIAVDEVLPAKAFASKPDVALSVRFAVEGDRKAPGAAVRSRYYLLHPEHDPDERRRNHQENRSRYRDRDDNSRYRRGTRRPREHSESPPQRFDASMYDEAPANDRSQTSRDGPKEVSTQRNHGKELFSNYDHRERDRSASPTGSRLRDRTSSSKDYSRASENRLSARQAKDQLSASKELFPTRQTSGRGRLDELEDAIGSAHLREEDYPKLVRTEIHVKGAAAEQAKPEGISIKGRASAKELFPQRLGNDNSSKELFAGAGTNRRRKAEDLFS